MGQWHCCGAAWRGEREPMRADRRPGGPQAAKNRALGDARRGVLSAARSQPRAAHAGERWLIAHRVEEMGDGRCTNGTAALAAAATATTATLPPPPQARCPREAPRGERAGRPACPPQRAGIVCWRWWWLLAPSDAAASIARASRAVLKELDTRGRSPRLKARRRCPTQGTQLTRREFCRRPRSAQTRRLSTSRSAAAIARGRTILVQGEGHEAPLAVEAGDARYSEADTSPPAKTARAAVERHCAAAAAATIFRKSDAAAATRRHGQLAPATRAAAAAGPAASGPPWAACTPRLQARD
eukprot:202290-Chlamydomonas_euryale.AAC.1